MKKHTTSYLYLFILLSMSTNISAGHCHQAIHCEPASTDVWMNVFLHGIISITPFSTLTNLLRFLNDNVAGSLYGQTVCAMREDSFFYQNQPMQAPGLHPIDLANYSKGAAASIMARIFNATNNLNSPTKSTQLYYTYGWTGLLSRSVRYQDSKQFLCELEQEIMRLRQLGLTPKIRLIGYSHGGSIILKLALVKRLEQIKPTFSVDETYFLGTPIQYDTDYLIADPLFKKVYNIFSRSDRVQQLDFFSCGQFFSGQVFTPHFGFEKLPKNLTQIEIRLIRKAGEKCKRLTADQECLPLLYDGVKWSRNIRNVSPGHTELWFFGWTPLNYRRSFVLYPLPLVAFLPFIINTITPLADYFYSEYPITVTIDPRRNSMIVNNNAPYEETIFKFPFVGMKNLIAFTQEVLQYAPDPFWYNYSLFNQHIEKALCHAAKCLCIKRDNYPPLKNKQLFLRQNDDIE